MAMKTGTLVHIIKLNEKEKMTGFARKLLEAAEKVEASQSK